MLSYEKGFSYAICGGDIYGWKVTINGKKLPKKYPSLQMAKGIVNRRYLWYLKDAGRV